MSLALTPINEAWTSQLNSSSKKDPNKNKQSSFTNTYTSPDMQNKILMDLGMVEKFSNDNENEKQNTMSLQITNPELIHYFQPYSNNYIETFILKAMKNQNNNSSAALSPEVLDTIENIYTIVSFILVLIIIDIMLRIKK